jgi:transporter family-2 protein
VHNQGNSYDYAMKLNPYYLLDFSAGAVISVMAVCNTLLGEQSTIGVSMIVNQAVGIIVLCILMWFLRNNKTLSPKRQHAPWYLWMNGFFGIAIISINCITILHMGAALSMAATVFGQSIAGFLFDLTGFMHMEKRSFSKQKLLSLLISLAGIIVMALGSDTYPVSFILLSMLAGALTITQMVMNSTFAEKKGALFAARQNVISGLFGGLLFFLLTDFEGTISGFQKFPGIPWYLVIGGGALGCYIVTATNLAVRKVPAVYSSLLLASSQVLMSLVLDAVIFSTFNILMLLGAVVMILGMSLALLQREIR